MSVTDKWKLEGGMDYIKIYSEEYLSPIYYYCLKKTGSKEQAEELSAEINLEVLKGLAKTVPMYFSAWVWKIVRNRYSRWAKAKRFHIDSECAADINDMEELADNTCLEEDILHKENLQTLRRELALIQADYRNILVAFYIEDRKISDIAHTLSLPEGTVKSRLFLGRKKLKEGMNMAREYGIRSYKPEEVRFAASGRQGDNGPFKYVSRKAAKNILLEAHNNPSTIEELSIELGIAAPYMEEEVALLEEGELLKKTEGNKYATNFFIADKDTQIAVHHLLHDGSKDRYRLLSKIIEDKLPEIKILDIIRSNMKDNIIKWIMYPLIVNIIINKIPDFDVWGSSFKHKDGSTWGFMGFEESDEIPRTPWMGHNGNGDKRGYMWVFEFGDFGFQYRKGWVDYGQAVLLLDVIKKHRKYDSLTEAERITWTNIEGFLAHTDENGKLIPDFAVFEGNACNRMMTIISDHPLYNELYDSFNAVYTEIKGILTKNSISLLHKYIDYYTSMFMCASRMIMVTDAVEAGELIVPEDTEHSPAGMYMDLY